MSGKFALVTDGAVTLPAEYVREHQIAIAHDHISFGMDSYTPLADLTDERFYELIRSRKDHPSTSQPSLGDIRSAFDEALRHSKDVIAVTVDQTRSGTFGTMSTAAQSLPGRFEIVDSRSVSGGQGLIVMAIARARQDGASFEEAASLARSLAQRVRVLAYIDTLDYLKRSGRVSAVAGLVGSILSIRPLIKFAGGEPEVIEKLRTRSRGLERLRESVKETVKEGSRVQAFVLHTNAADDARQLGVWARRTYHCVEYFEQEAGAVLATHVGPGVVGIGLIPEE